MTLPPLPSIDLERGMFYHATEYVLNDQSCLGATLVLSQDRTTIHLYELLDGVWKNHTSSTLEGAPVSTSGDMILLTNHTLYIGCSGPKIIVLYLFSSVLSVINLPDGLEYKYDNLGLSQADDTGFNLVHLKGLELHIWLCTHKRSSNNNNICDNWLLVHTICLREVCASMRMPTRALENRKNTGVKLHAVGDNAKFVFLEICGVVIYLDIASRAAKKLYTLAPGDGDIYKIHPFMMIWPPTLHALKDGPARFVFWPLGDVIIFCFCVVALEA